MEKNAEYYIDAARNTSTSTVYDVMKKRGIENRCTFGFDYTTSDKVLTGFAHTAKCVPSENGSWKRADFDKIFNGIKQGDVLVLTNEGAAIASIGDMASLCAKTKGALGAIVDGYIRDADAISKMDWKVCAKGYTPISAGGKVDLLKVESKVVCGGAEVEEGDFVIADISGIVFIPKDIYKEIIEEALVVESKEDATRANILSGMDFSKSIV